MKYCRGCSKKRLKKLPQILSLNKKNNHCAKMIMITPSTLDIFYIFNKTALRMKKMQEGIHFNGDQRLNTSLFLHEPFV